MVWPTTQGTVYISVQSRTVCSWNSLSLLVAVGKHSGWLFARDSSPLDNSKDEAGADGNTATSAISFHFQTHPLSDSNAPGHNTNGLLFLRFTYIFAFQKQHHPFPPFMWLKPTYFFCPCFLWHVLQSFWNILLHSLPAGTVLQCLTLQISTSVQNTLQ